MVNDVTKYYGYRLDFEPTLAAVCHTSSSTEVRYGSATVQWPVGACGFPKVTGRLRCLDTVNGPVNYGQLKA